MKALPKCKSMQLSLASSLSYDVMHRCAANELMLCALAKPYVQMHAVARAGEGA